MNSQIKPGVALNHIIPIQLVETVANISELTEQNVLEMRFFTDVALEAFQITTGYYIKHIKLEIIWMNARICFRFLFFSFCISIRIPIGFRITFERKDFGETINGKTILERRVIDAKIYELQM